ncbi:hypothetical protein ES703_14621 [subsurface metagenome]
MPRGMGFDSFPGYGSASMMASTSARSVFSIAFAPNP